MQALVYDRFGAEPRVRTVPDPALPDDGVLVRVRATGLCRSDWHAWRGHDADVVPPHVPGHEFAGDVVAAGPAVRHWAPPARVTAPFVCACGSCPECLAGEHQVCRRQQQPGFTYWGSFAELVAVPRADVNLVALPAPLSYESAATLGCRYATAFRAIVHVAGVRAGEHVAVHGCGGVGLAAVAIAAATGASVVAVDIDPDALALARELGAAACIDATATDDVARQVLKLTGGGAHVSLDALGSLATCAASIRGLRRRGRHVQVGLLPPDGDARSYVPMNRVVAYELQLLGSHGMPAHHYPRLLGLVASGALDPARLVRRRIGLEAAGPALTQMASEPHAGVTVVLP